MLYVSILLLIIIILFISLVYINKKYENNILKNRNKQQNIKIEDKKLKINFIMEKIRKRKRVMSMSFILCNFIQKKDIKFFQMDM